MSKEKSERQRQALTKVLLSLEISVHVSCLVHLLKYVLAQRALAINRMLHGPWFGVSQKGLANGVSPFFSENETEKNGKKRKKTEENGKKRKETEKNGRNGKNGKKRKNRNPKKQQKRKKKGKKRKKNGKKRKKQKKNGKNGTNGRKRKKTEENGKKTGKKRKKTEENGRKRKKTEKIGSDTVPATPFAKPRVVHWKDSRSHADAVPRLTLAQAFTRHTLSLPPPPHNNHGPS